VLISLSGSTPDSSVGVQKKPGSILFPPVTSVAPAATARWTMLRRAEERGRLGGPVSVHIEQTPVRPAARTPARRPVALASITG
jgi:hypothetical protein